MEININTNEYEILFVSSMCDQLVNKSALGLCMVMSKKIYIANDVPDMIGLLIHELSHAYIHEYLGMNVEWDEEKVVEFVQRYSRKINEDASNIFEWYKKIVGIKNDK